MSERPSLSLVYFCQHFHTHTNQTRALYHAPTAMAPSKGRPIRVRYDLANVCRSAQRRNAAKKGFAKVFISKTDIAKVSQFEFAAFCPQWIVSNGVGRLTCFTQSDAAKAKKLDRCKKLYFLFYLPKPASLL